MRLNRKMIDSIASSYTCGKCDDVELVLVWISNSHWFIHCPLCQTEFQIVISMRVKEIDCPDEEK